MRKAAVEVNPELSLQLLAVGAEQVPVIVIDNFLRDTGDVIHHACHEVSFQADATSAYPGRRAPLMREYVIASMQALFPLFTKLYAIPTARQPKFQNAVYSLIGTPPEQLTPLQRLPHFDSNKPHFLAVTHYLSPAPFGGTGFYRHRPTGFETVSQPRLARYIEAGDAFLSEHGEPSPAYFDASDTHFERVAQVDYQPNRLLAYPGRLLHSGLIKPERDINCDPHTGRLTANVFVDFQ